MHWLLILLLSLAGLPVGLLSVYLVPLNGLPGVWLLVFLPAAYVLAKKGHQRFFLHGFLAGAIAQVWVTLLQVKTEQVYLLHHAKEAAKLAASHAQSGITFTQIMVASGIFMGLMSGVVLGAFARMANKAFNVGFKPPRR